MYVIGDVAIHKRNLARLSELNGTKVLIAGNHDTEKASKYLEYFKDVRGSHQIDKLLLTHIPIHTGSLSKHRCNVHGHLHTSQVMLDSKVDTKYLNVSVEQPWMQYTPISLCELNKLISKRQEEILT